MVCLHVKWLFMLCSIYRTVYYLLALMCTLKNQNYYGMLNIEQCTPKESSWRLGDSISAQRVVVLQANEYGNWFTWKFYHYFQICWRSATDDQNWKATNGLLYFGKKASATSRVSQQLTITATRWDINRRTPVGARSRRCGGNDRNHLSAVSSSKQGVKTPTAGRPPRERKRKARTDWCCGSSLTF